MSRPNFITREHLEYLDELRESGETNMYGAARYVEEEFEIGGEIDCIFGVTSTYYRLPGE